MDERMNACNCKPMDGWTDGWMDGWMDAWTTGSVDVWTDEVVLVATRYCKRFRDTPPLIVLMLLSVPVLYAMATGSIVHGRC